jgi:hypothetical protein
MQLRGNHQTPEENKTHSSASAFRSFGFHFSRMAEGSKTPFLGLNQIKINELKLQTSGFCSISIGSEMLEGKNDFI